MLAVCLLLYGIFTSSKCLDTWILIPGTFIFTAHVAPPALNLQVDVVVQNGWTKPLGKPRDMYTSGTLSTEYACGFSG